METIDELLTGKQKVIQSAHGYRLSLDPVLLCSFAVVRRGEAILDLGAGNGVVPLLLANFDAGKIVGLERQPAMVNRACRSVELSGLTDKVEIMEADLRFHRQLFQAQSFDVVLTNPPYRRLGTGCQSPNSERGRARHELAGGLDDFLEAAAWCLGDGGRFYIVYLPERLPELLTKMGQRRLEPKRLRCVHGRTGKSARIVLVEGRKGGRPGLDVEPPLYVFDGEGYSEEVQRMYAEVQSGH